MAKMKDSLKYDDGSMCQQTEPSIEEEAENLKGILLREGWDWEDAEYARHMWEKD